MTNPDFSPGLPSFVISWVPRHGRSSSLDEHKRVSQMFTYESPHPSCQQSHTGVHRAVGPTSADTSSPWVLPGGTQNHCCHHHRVFIRTLWNLGYDFCLIGDEVVREISQDPIAGKLYRRDHTQGTTYHRFLYPSYLSHFHENCCLELNHVSFPGQLGLCRPQLGPWLPM